MRPVTVIELNELNFEYVQRYVSAGKLPNFKALLESSALNLTTSEHRYHELEPWIQWVTAHTGLTLAQHGVFRLGDICGADIDQVWEKLEDNGLRVGALSPMNASNRLRKPAFFLPDPWTETPMVAPKGVGRVYSAIARAVSQNAEGRMDPATLSDLMIGLIRFARPANYFRYFSLAALSLTRPWLRAAFLDLFLSDIFVGLLRATKPEFSTGFFNAAAHVQHHYMFSSSVYDGPRSNPEWYVKSGQDPILDIYKVYDEIVRAITQVLPGTRLMIATGLHQVPHEIETYYWRLRDHAQFLTEAGVCFTSVRPLMSRDFVVTFPSAEAASIAEHLLQNAFASDGVSLFTIDNRGADLFVELVYGNVIGRDLTWHVGAVSFANVRDLVAFVAIKNGGHNGLGYFIDTGEPSREAKLFPLAELERRMMAACGVSTTLQSPVPGQEKG
jgi:hypothetical protein